MVKCLWGPEDDTRSCETELTGSQEPPNMSARNQRRVWKEERMLLTTEPPLLSLIFYSYILHTNSSKCIWKFAHGKNCPFKNIFLGPGEKVQSIKHLTDNQEEWSSIRRMHVKQPGMETCSCNTYAEEPGTSGSLEPAEELQASKRLGFTK